MKEMFLAYDQECCKVQLKVTSLSKKWIFFFVITKKQTLVFRYMSSMQLNIEIRESIWFLTTPATVLGVSNSYQTRTGYINISRHLRVRFCFTTRTPHLYWLLYSQCFAGNSALKILKSKGEYQTAFSRLCGDIDNSPDTGDAFGIHVQTLWFEEDK